MQRRKKKQMGWLENSFVVLVLITIVFLIAYYGYLIFSRI